MKHLPIPPTPPSGKATRIMRQIRELVDGAEEPEAKVQLVTDLQHLYRAAYDPYDTAIYEAVRKYDASTFRGMAERTGLSRSAVQLRVDNADPSKPTRTETLKHWRERPAVTEGAEPAANGDTE